MSDVMRTRLKLGAVLVAATVALGLGGCASEGTSAGNLNDGSSSNGQSGNVDSPGGEAPGSDSKDSLAGLDHAAVLAMGIEGGAAITCGYTFDATELEGMRLVEEIGIREATPEATVHLNGKLVHWEIPQKADRLSHILLNNGIQYEWMAPGESTGTQADVDEREELPALARAMRANAHDCVAFTGPTSMFEVPTGLRFDQF